MDWRFELLDPRLSGAEAAAGLSAAGAACRSSASSSSPGAGAGVAYGAAGTCGGQLDVTLFRGPAPPPGVDGVEVCTQTKKNEKAE